MLTVGSLFSGIGGLELGLERAGMSVSWQVEKDPFCRAVLARHWPNVTRFEDVKDVGQRNLTAVDLICGGFPCQDISSAGRGAGLKGVRSGLWFEFRRIIEEIRPCYALIENSPHLRSRGLEIVLQGLDALGYDAEWHCIPASHVGAHHRRDRVWIFAYSHRDKLWQQSGRSVGQNRACSALLGLNGEIGPVAGADGDGQLRPRLSEVERDCLPESARRSGGSGRGALPDADHWKVEPDVGRVADGVPARVDRLRALGNAVVPQVAEFIGRQIVAVETRRIETAA